MKKPFSKKLQSIFDSEASKIVFGAYREAERLIKENQTKLEILAKELLKKETLSYDDVVRLIGPPLYKDFKTFVDNPESVLPEALSGSGQDEERPAAPNGRRESED